jgi:hypothetical protein
LAGGAETAGRLSPCGPDEGAPCARCRAWATRAKAASKAKPATAAAARVGQLRVELARVKGRRADVQAELDALSRAALSGGGGGDDAGLQLPPPPAAPSLRRQLTAGSAAAAVDLKPTVSQPRARGTLLNLVINPAVPASRALVEGVFL